MKRFSLIITILLFQLLAYSANNSDKTNTAKPNIILLFSDDAGYADFGFQGSTEMITPNLDKLAEEGIRFTQGYVTGSSCGPSRAGLLTGRYQQRFGFEENNVPGYMSSNSALDGDEMGIPLTERLIGEYMKEQGYATAYYGKWHMGGADCFHPCNRGFDEFYGFRGGARSYWAYLDEPAEHLNKLERNLGHFEEHDGYLTERLAEEAIDFIERNKEKPFFAIVAYNAVHTPMDAMDEDLEQFPQFTGLRKKVAAMTLAMDRASGQILDKLKELGLDENTIVVFANDNGGPTDKNGSVNRPLSGTKSNQLEGGIRVPYVIRWPQKLQAGEYHYPVSTLDFLPTFVNAAGGNADTISNIDGVDLLPYMLGENNERPHNVLYWKKDCRATIRLGDYKLLRFPDRPAELYNIEKDIAEHKNLARKHPDKVKEMYKMLFEWESELERPRWLLQRKFENFDIERMDKYR